jgi:hypothetical protein
VLEIEQYYREEQTNLSAWPSSLLTSGSASSHRLSSSSRSIYSTRQSSNKGAWTSGKRPCESEERKGDPLRGTVREIERHKNVRKATYINESAFDMRPAPVLGTVLLRRMLGLELCAPPRRLARFRLSARLSLRPHMAVCWPQVTVSCMLCRLIPQPLVASARKRPRQTQLSEARTRHCWLTERHATTDGRSRKLDSIYRESSSGSRARISVMRRLA